MIQISSNSWHMRVYNWWYELKYEHARWNKQTNLCPYMRAVCIWAPMRVLFGNGILLKEFNSDAIPPLYLSMIVAPIVMYVVPLLLGYVSYIVKMTLWELFFIVSLAIILVFVISSTVILIEHRIKVRQKRNPTKIEAQITGFLHLIHEWMKSAHDQVCPTVVEVRESKRKESIP